MECVGRPFRLSRRSVESWLDTDSDQMILETDPPTDGVTAASLCLCQVRFAKAEGKGRGEAPRRRHSTDYSTYIRTYLQYVQAVDYIRQAGSEEQPRKKGKKGSERRRTEVVEYGTIYTECMYCLRLLLVLLASRLLGLLLLLLFRPLFVAQLYLVARRPSLLSWLGCCHF